MFIAIIGTLCLLGSIGFVIGKDPISFALTGGMIIFGGGFFLFVLAVLFAAAH